jgi:hypothetical protein
MSAPLDWRKHLRVHPAAELFPPMSEAELKELTDDIKARGLRISIIKWKPRPESEYEALLDGRNRLDALAAADLLVVNDKEQLRLKVFDPASSTYRLDPLPTFSHAGGDPYKIALSLNVLRRHLKPDQKHDLIAKLLKAQPDKSDRAIAREAEVDRATVAKVRADLEDVAEISHVETRTDSMGRQQPAKKAKPTSKPKPARAVAPKDTALLAFTERVLDLVQRISNHKPGRFAGTAVKADDLAKLGEFFADVASLKRGSPP